MTDNANPQDVLFVSLISQFQASAMIGLGQVPNPVTNKTEKSLEHAKYAIDVLGMLEKKTKGNLNDEETKVLQQALSGLRMAYVEEVNKDK